MDISGSILPSYSRFSQLTCNLSQGDEVQNLIYPIGCCAADGEYELNMSVMVREVLGGSTSVYLDSWFRMHYTGQWLTRGWFEWDDIGDLGGHHDPANGQQEEGSGRWFPCPHMRDLSVKCYKIFVYTETCIENRLVGDCSRDLVMVQTHRPTWRRYSCSSGLFPQHVYISYNRLVKLECNLQLGNFLC